MGAGSPFGRRLKVLQTVSRGPLPKETDPRENKIGSTRFLINLPKDFAIPSPLGVAFAAPAG
ncbi:MAG: hypothetical protein NVSMB14_03700 [Isosphaeraceae bacterium]